MTEGPPDPVTDLARARAAARSRGDWTEADRLRGEIEAAGWRVVDDGLSFRLARAHPADVEIGGRLRYGWSGSVPSRLDAPATTAATVIVVVADGADELSRAVTGVLRHAPAGTHVVIVADAPTPEVVTRIDALAPLGGGPAEPEAVLTVEPLGVAGAVNAGIRRAAGEVVVVLDAGVEPGGDLVTPLVRALDDPTVAAAGAWGVAGPDLRRLADAPAGEVTAIDWGCQAFRRSDAAARGPLDERLRGPRSVAIWWSLALRDGGDGRPPRRAVRVDGLPLARAGAAAGAERPFDARDRATRRDLYRILDRFGARDDLLGRGTRPSPAATETGETAGRP